jgi:hypothetical protein
MLALLIMLLTVTNGKNYFILKKLVNGLGLQPYFDPEPIYEHYMRAGTTMDYFLYASDPENDTLTFGLYTGYSGYGNSYTFEAPNKIVMSPPSVRDWCIQAWVSDGSSNITIHFDLNSMPLTWNPTPTLTHALSP